MEGKRSSSDGDKPAKKARGKNVSVILSKSQEEAASAIAGSCLSTHKLTKNELGLETFVTLNKFLTVFSAPVNAGKTFVLLRFLQRLVETASLNHYYNQRAQLGYVKQYHYIFQNLTTMPRFSDVNFSKIDERLRIPSNKYLIVVPCVLHAQWIEKSARFFGKTNVDDWICFDTVTKKNATNNIYILTPKMVDNFYKQLEREKAKLFFDVIVVDEITGWLSEEQVRKWLPFFCVYATAQHEKVPETANIFPHSDFTAMFKNPHITLPTPYPPSLKFDPEKTQKFVNLQYQEPLVYHNSTLVYDAGRLYPNFLRIKEEFLIECLKISTAPISMLDELKATKEILNERKCIVCLDEPPQVEINFLGQLAKLEVDANNFLGKELIDLAVRTNPKLEPVKNLLVAKLNDSIVDQAHRLQLKKGDKITIVEETLLNLIEPISPASTEPIPSAATEPISPPLFLTQELVNDFIHNEEHVPKSFIRLVCCKKSCCNLCFDRLVATASRTCPHCRADLTRTLKILFLQIDNKFRDNLLYNIVSLRARDPNKKLVVINNLKRQFQSKIIDLNSALRNLFGKCAAPNFKTFLNNNKKTFWLYCSDEIDCGYDLDTIQMAIILLDQKEGVDGSIDRFVGRLQRPSRKEACEIFTFMVGVAQPNQPDSFNEFISGFFLMNKKLL